MAFWSDFGFQNLVSLTSSFLESLHDVVTVWLLVILSLVSIISMMVILSAPGSLPLDSLTLEVSWTLIPMVILLTIVFPSIKLLSSQDTIFSPPKGSVKVVSSQWNWQSEAWISDSFDHLLDPVNLDSTSSQEVPVTLGKATLYRILVTSTDVLHSLGIPSFGIKLDATPGRLNATTMESPVSGLFLGSCFELCGSGHSMMPLSVLIT